MKSIHDRDLADGCGRVLSPTGNGAYVTDASNGAGVRPHPSHASHTSQAPITFETFRPFFETRSSEVLANIVICLVHQANYLLGQQLKRLEEDFVVDGGLRERMTRARPAERNKQRASRRRVKNTRGRFRELQDSPGVR